MPRTALTRATSWLVGAAGLLVWLAWPHSADTDVRQAYTQLEGSPVPARVLGWITPTQARVELLANGYVLSLHAERLGDVTISGQRGALTAAQDGLRWQDGDVTYALQTTADQQVVQPRIVPLQVARTQLEGRAWDTPLLFLGYLPAFVVFGLWATRSLLRS